MLSLRAARRDRAAGRARRRRSPSAPASRSAALRRARCAAPGSRSGVDFAARDSATLGGMAATDAGGAQVLRARDDAGARRRAGGRAGRRERRAAPLGPREGQRRLRPAGAARRLGGDAGRDLARCGWRSCPRSAHVVAGAARRWARWSEAVALVARLRARLPSLQAADFLLGEGIDARVPRTARLAPPFAGRAPGLRAGRVRRVRGPHGGAGGGARRTRWPCATWRSPTTRPGARRCGPTARRSTRRSTRPASRTSSTSRVPLAGVAGVRRRRSRRRSPRPAPDARRSSTATSATATCTSTSSGRSPTTSRSTTPVLAIVAAHGGVDQRRARRRRGQAALARPHAHAGGARGDARDQGRAGPRRASSTPASSSRAARLRPLSRGSGPRR